MCNHVDPSSDAYISELRVTWPDQDRKLQCLIDDNCILLALDKCSRTDTCSSVVEVDVGMYSVETCIFVMGLLLI
jgi:hypothetical protein